MKTTYKGVAVDTKAYRRVMALVGQCVAAGGVVQYDHDQKITRGGFGEIYTTNTIDVTLEW